MPTNFIKKKTTRRFFRLFVFFLRILRKQKIAVVFDILSNSAQRARADPLVPIGKTVAIVRALEGNADFGREINFIGLDF